MTRESQGGTRPTTFTEQLQELVLEHRRNQELVREEGDLKVADSIKSYIPIMLEFIEHRLTETAKLGRVEVTFSFDEFGRVADSADIDRKLSVSEFHAARQKYRTRVLDSIVKALRKKHPSLHVRTFYGSDTGNVTVDWSNHSDI